MCCASVQMINTGFSSDSSALIATLLALPCSWCQCTIWPLFCGLGGFSGELFSKVFNEDLSVAIVVDRVLRASLIELVIQRDGL